MWRSCAARRLAFHYWGSQELLQPVAEPSPTQKVVISHCIMWGTPLFFAPCNAYCFRIDSIWKTAGPIVTCILPSVYGGLSAVRTIALQALGPIRPLTAPARQCCVSPRNTPSRRDKSLMVSYLVYRLLASQPASLLLILPSFLITVILLAIGIEERHGRHASYRGQGGRAGPPAGDRYRVRGCRRARAHCSYGWPTSQERRAAEEYNAQLRIETEAVEAVVLNAAPWPRRRTLGVARRRARHP